MTKKYILFLIILTSLFFLFFSCKKELMGQDGFTYFGGEVINPTSRYVLLCKNSEVIDSIPLKSNNTFLQKFDTLSSGLYTFRYSQEYQYIYFDKNDSLMVHIDTKNFDESIVYGGIGDEKNNFLMEMFLRNEAEKNEMFAVFDSDFKTFSKKIDKKHKENQVFYQAKKDGIAWNDEFDVVAKAYLDYPYFSKKEVYPLVHKLRTGIDITDQIPKNFYDFRKNIDYNNQNLAYFSPFVNYLNQMFNNMGNVNYHNHYNEIDLALKTNINKLNIADSLIQNSKVKNLILNNIAFQYLLEDQNMENNHDFLKIYEKYSTDKSNKNEITKLGNSIQKLTCDKPLPEVTLMDINGKLVSSNEVINKKTVIFFWSESLKSHFEAARTKIIEIQKKHIDYQFVAINLDESKENWKIILKNYNFSNLNEYHCVDFEDIKSKWAITKIHRTLIINSDKIIKNGFTNIFDVNFESQL